MTLKMVKMMLFDFVIVIIRVHVNEILSVTSKSTSYFESEIIRLCERLLGFFSAVMRWSDKEFHGVFKTT